MEIIKIRTTRENGSWQEIVDAIRAGKAKEMFNIGDRLTVNHSDYGLLEFDILDFDRDMPAEAGSGLCHTVTLQLHDLVPPEMPFDEDNKNSWENSSIRAWLNSPDFICGFDPEFASMIAPVSKVTNPDTSKEEHTQDSFFLLSEEEIDPDNGGYEYYKNRHNLIKLDSDANSDWWFLRSANRGSASAVWYVSSAGYVTSYHACHANRCAPACVIG